MGDPVTPRGSRRQESQTCSCRLGEHWRHLETSGDWTCDAPSLHPIRVGQGVVWKFSTTDSGRNVAAGMQAFAGKVQVEVQ